MSLSKFFHILFQTKIAIFKYAEEQADAIIFWFAGTIGGCQIPLIAYPQ